MTLPSTLALAEGALVARDSVLIQPSVGITGNSATSAVVAGALGVTAKLYSTVPSLWSLGNVTLSSSMTVNGSVHAAGTLSKKSSTRITGVLEQGSPIATRSALTFDVTFPDAPTPAVTLSGQSMTLSPGRYGDVKLYAASTLTLTAGKYYFESLAARLDTTLVVDDSGGPVEVYVAGASELSSRVSTASGTSANFLVVVFGTVAEVWSPAFVGTLVAPNALAHFLGGTGSTFRGSVFARDIRLGANLTMLHEPSAALNRLTVPPQPPRRLPAPPREFGCYVGTINGWAQVPCTPSTAAAADNLAFGLPEPAIETIPPAMGARVAFEYGEVETTFVAIGGVNDVYAPTGQVLPNALSVQLNTNEWVAPAGNEAMVQLVIQSQQAGSRICVWNVDVTRALKKDLTAYVMECVGGNSNSGFHVPRRPGAYRQLDYAAVGGSTYTTTAGAPAIGMVTQLSWWDPANDPGGNRGLYAVVAPDTHGLAGNWTETSGTVYGQGGGSEARFTDTAVLTRILSGSCANAPGPTGDIPWPGVCPVDPPLLPDTRLMPTSGTQTAETNNLIQVGQPTALASLTSDLVFTQYLATTSGTCLVGGGGERVFVRDTPQDTGVVPSNPGGQSFWESPDLFVVPAGAVVDVDAVASSTLITPSEPYDIYVRVNNDFGCTDASGVKALVYLADPSALSASWKPVTGGQYLGGPGFPGGHRVPAGGRALIGPFSWTAPPAGAIDSPHKCMVGAISSDTQAPPASVFDAPNSFQVAQRNVQLYDCTWPLTNATTTAGSAKLVLTVPSGVDPATDGAELVQVSFTDPTASWRDIWLPGAGSDYSVSNTAGVTTIVLGQRMVTLAAVPLGAGETRTATGSMSLGGGAPTTTLTLGATLEDGAGTVLVTNGGSCLQSASEGPS